MNVAILSEGQREVQVETRKGENIFNNIQAQKVDCSLAVLSNRPKTTADTQF